MLNAMPRVPCAILFLSLPKALYLSFTTVILPSPAVHSKGTNIVVASLHVIHYMVSGHRLSVRDNTNSQTVSQQHKKADLWTCHPPLGLRNLYEVETKLRPRGQQIYQDEWVDVRNDIPLPG